jgi:DNA polymerase III epsilon subunit-like protein
MNYVFIDTETGGLDPKVHGITEIGAVIFDWNKSTCEVKHIEGFNILIKPNEIMAYTPFALKLQGRTLESLQEEGVTEREAWWLFAQKIHPYIPNWTKSDKIMAHYAQFDYGFMAAIAQRACPEVRMAQGDHRCHWSCTKNLWTWMRGLGVHEQPKSHLADIATYYQIKQEAAHTALDDALVGVECFKNMMLDLKRFFGEE